MRADRIEVAQRHCAASSIGGAPVAQDLLDHRLRVPVGSTGRIGACSVSGSASGTPYTVADELKTMQLTSRLAIASSNASVPPTLLS